MEYTPYTSVWGGVSNVTAAPRRRGHILVTVAGQTLCMQQNTDGGLKKLGLLRLSKRRNTVFLVFTENLATKTHSILVGWRNPSDLLARQMQAVISTNDSGAIFEMVAVLSEEPSTRPTWKDFDFEE